MEAHIEHDIATGGHRVWILERGMGALRVLRFEQRRGEPPWAVWEEVPERQREVTPTMLLPRDALEALMLVSRQIVKATDATVDALADARDVRDRMITLVERGWMPPAETRQL